MWSPLTTGTRVFYWLILGLSVVGMIAAFASGWFAIPGGATLVAATVLMVDASLRRRIADAAAVSALITAAAVSGLFAILIVAGLNNSYSFTVVDQPEQTIQEAGGIDLISGEQICGGDEDYNNCVNMHVAMYNTVCLAPQSPFEDFGGSSLSPASVATCGDLSAFIDDVLARADSCGYGCTTIADENGRWGWAFLNPHARSTEVLIPEITHEEYCWFELGAISLGNCRDQTETIDSAALP